MHSTFVGNQSVDNIESVINATHFGILYDANDDVVSTRLSLARTWELYLALCVQSVITLVSFVGIMVMRDTPVSQGFGLVSILAGVERRGLDLLRGASLSGELDEDVFVSIRQVGDVADAKIWSMLWRGGRRRGRMAR